MPNSNTMAGGNVYITYTPTTSNVSIPITSTINLSSGSSNYSIYATSSPYTFTNGTQPQMSVQGGGTFTGTVDAADIVIDGVSLKDTLKGIQDRLAILVPDPKKLEKFAALKASYEHYLLLEKLCTENPPDEA